MGGTQKHRDVCFPALRGEKRLKEEKTQDDFAARDSSLSNTVVARGGVPGFEEPKEEPGVSYTVAVKVKRRAISNRDALEEKWRKQKKSRMNLADGQETGVSC